MEEVEVSWPKGVDGTNNPIVGYRLQVYSCNTSSGVYSLEDTISLGSGSRGTTVKLADYAARGKYVKFRIGVEG